MKPRGHFAPGARDLSWRLAGVVVTAVINECVTSPLTRTVAQAVIIAAVALAPPAVTSARAHDSRMAGTPSSPAHGMAPGLTDRHDRATAGFTGPVHGCGDVHGCNRSPVVHDVLVIAVRDVWQSPPVGRRAHRARTPAPGTSSVPGTWPAGGLVLGAQDDLHLPDGDPSAARGVQLLELGVPDPRSSLTAAPDHPGETRTTRAVS